MIVHVLFLNLTCFPLYPVEINKTEMNNVQKIYIFYVECVYYKVQNLPHILADLDHGPVKGPSQRMKLLKTIFLSYEKKKYLCKQQNDEDNPLSCHINKKNTPHFFFLMASPLPPLRK